MSTKQKKAKKNISLAGRTLSHQKAENEKMKGKKVKLLSILNDKKKINNWKQKLNQIRNSH